MGKLKTRKYEYNDAYEIKEDDVYLSTKELIKVTKKLHEEV